MATVNKDFKVKNGLIVEGTTATVNNFDVLTKKAEDENFIIGLIGGTATSENTANTVVKRDANGDFAAGTITADLTGNADTATALETARTITLAGDVTGSVSFDGTASVSITATIDGSFATDAEVATAKGEAIADAATDATTKANAAQSAAEATASADATSKANAAQSAAEATASADATSKANAAQSAAEATASADATSKANAAQSAAEATASADATAKADAAEAAAIAHADGAVAGLVDSAPELLNTLNELAAALGDSPDTISNLTTLVGTKADTSYVNSEISDLDTELKTYADTAEADAITTASADATAKVAAEAALRVSGDSASVSTASADATAKANAAQSAAEATASADATAKADAAEAAAIAHADALDTDDIAEGTAQYFTDARAKTSAADLLTGATLSNITITGSGSGLVITAENGVADSDTDDLTEGATNLYFTDARAVDALEAVVPNFTEVDINSVATQVAASIEVATASTVTAYQFDSATYRSAKFLVKFASGTHTEVSEVLLTLDTSDNIAITEYALVGTNGNLGDVTADVNDGNVRLRVATINNNTDVTVMGTLLV